MSYSDKQSFYKDRINKKISGVCAGLANGNGFPVWSVRLAAVFLLFMFPAAALLSYFAAALILPSRYY